MRMALTTSLLVILLLSACTQVDNSAPAATAVSSEDSPADTVPEPTAAAVLAEDTAEPEPTLVETVPPATAEPEPTVVVEAATATTGPLVEPIDVTYFTPSQQEGPYYTVDKPQDRDNDLVDFAGAAGQPEGEVLHLSGVVYDVNGFPAEGITIEIWQTDSKGAYLHPRDPATESRDRNFQFYGESVTGPDGVYSFRTIVPGPYEPRPRHIHVKVKQDGQELLTTQFYFADELDLQGSDAAMLIETAPAEDDAGRPILVGERDIILSLPLTG